MSERAPTDLDGLIRRSREAARSSPTGVPTRAASGESPVDDHTDALAAAERRFEEAFGRLGRAESVRTRLSRLVGRHETAPADAALLALRDLVERLDTRHRHDIEYVLEHLAELERRSIVADEVARRVELLEHSPDSAVIDLAHFASWFAQTDLVLWLGDTDGPLHRAIAGAGPVVVYGASPPGTERPVGAAVVTGRPVTVDVVDQVTEIITTEGLLAVVVDTAADVSAVATMVAHAGFSAVGLTLLSDDLRGVAGSLVATFRRSQPR